MRDCIQGGRYGFALPAVMVLKEVSWEGGIAANAAVAAVVSAVGLVALARRCLLSVCGPGSVVHNRTLLLFSVKSPSFSVRRSVFSVLGPSFHCRELVVQWVRPVDHGGMLFVLFVRPFFHGTVGCCLFMVGHCSVCRAALRFPWDAHRVVARCCRRMLIVQWVGPSFIIYRTLFVL